MIVSDRRSGNKRAPAFLCFIIIMLGIQAQPAIAAPAAADKKEFQNILQDSLEAVWTGQDFSPDLKLRQETLKNMLTTGSLAGAELDGMMEKMIFSIMDRHKTSRYILKAAPERINELFSPVIGWKEFRKIMWRAASSPAEKINPMLIKIGTLAPPGTPWITVPESITIPEMEELSAGRVLIKIYGGGVMGDDAEIINRMNDSQVDGCGCTALGVLEASPEASALLLPGLFNNYEEVDYICEKFRKRLDKAFADRGYILAALIDTGFLYMFSRNKIDDLADMKKQKVLTWFGAMETALYEDLGIDTTPLTVPEIVAALNMGTADAVLLPPVWMLGMQAYQYTKFYIKPPLFYSPAAIFVSVDTKNRLQKQIGASAIFAHNLQELIVSEFNSIEPEWKRQIRAYEEKSLKAFETKCGIKAIAFSTDEQQAIEKAGKAVQQKLSDKAFSEELIIEIRKALEEYRARH